MNRNQRRAFYRKTANLSRDQLVAAARDYLRDFEEFELTEVEREIERKMLAARHADRPLFHGGLRGRQIGDKLLPGSLTGENPHGFRDAEFRRRFVYCTPKPEEAKWFAQRSDGVVYQVQPDGEVWFDTRVVRTAWLFLGSELVKKEARKFGPRYGDQFLAVYANTGAVICRSATVLEVLHV
ncbi:hypothetical protein [Roseivivax sp. THAF30]|uniref:hypothetical protein n=1 Tax=Roseivivax sp. THAF30 TaxID=2587852 RepID=UPI001268D380|nr:hypothetical protein [Roseivivax sp. THAF30]QFT62074.1 hypothetical protein FIU91_03960 [Roseivivax sp. THAF30]